MITNSG